MHDDETARDGELQVQQRTKALSVQRRQIPLFGPDVQRWCRILLRHIFIWSQEALANDSAGGGRFSDAS
jgi:hypothetical protein